MIRTLRRTRTPATLFLTGMWAKAYPRAVRSLARDRLFELGAHTWDHRAWTGACYGLPAVGTRRAKLAELRRTARIIVRLSGARRGTSASRAVPCTRGLRLVAREGEQVVDGLASGDAFQSDPGVIERTVLDAVGPGSIVVMHMMGGPNAPATGQALARLIPELRRGAIAS